MILGAHWSFERLDLSNAIEEAELSLTFSLPLVAHAFRTGMHRCASVIDRPQSFSTAVLGNMFALGWSAVSILSASEKSVKFSKRYCETLFTNELFLPSENAHRLETKILPWGYIPRALSSRRCTNDAERKEKRMKVCTQRVCTVNQNSI